MIPMMISSMETPGLNFRSACQSDVVKWVTLIAATVLLRVYPRVNTIRTLPRGYRDIGGVVKSVWIGTFLRYPPNCLTLDRGVSGAAFWTFQFRLVVGHQQARQLGPRRI